MIFRPTWPAFIVFCAPLTTGSNGNLASVARWLSEGACRGFWRRSPAKEIADIQLIAVMTSSAKIALKRLRKTWIWNDDYLE